MVNTKTRRSVSLMLVLLALGTSTLAATAPSSKKLQVFILAGQSNMVGHANYITIPTLFTDQRAQVQRLSQLVFKPGANVSRATVDAQIATKIAHDKLNNQLRKKEITGDNQIAAAKAKLAKLRADYDAQTKRIKATFAVSQRVYISSIADNHRRSGSLTVGYGGNADKIGPELGFGLALERQLDAPILLIKTSWGGKSLHYNFRPPSAGPYALSEKEQAGKNAEQIRKNAGLNYRLMTEAVQAVLADLPAHHPEYQASAGHEIAGFVWFQGFNDQFSPAFRDNYRSNMVSFVKDVRKEFRAPKMPFVIGVMGTGITAEAVGKNAVSVAQREAAATPEFAGNVAAVESYRVYSLDALEVFNKGWAEHFAEWCVVGSDRPYHYLGSGKFFVRFGDALASSMARLLKARGS